jgi:hypothetical protein
VVLFAFEAFVAHIRSQGRRSHACQPVVGFDSQGEEGLCQWLVFGPSGGKAEAGDHPRRVDGNEQAETLVPSQAIGPSDVGETR